MWVRDRGEHSNCYSLLRTLPAGVHWRAFPETQEFESFLGGMQIAESGNLASQNEQPLLYFGIFQISLLIECFPSFRNGGLLGNDPGVERTAYGSQMT